MSTNQGLIKGFIDIPKIANDFEIVARGNELYLVTNKVKITRYFTITDVIDTKTYKLDKNIYDIPYDTPSLPVPAPPMSAPFKK